MKAPALSLLSPFMKLVMLQLLSFLCLALAMLLTSGVVTTLWGLSITDLDLSAMDASEIYKIQAGKFLLLVQHLAGFILPAWIFLRLSSHTPRTYLYAERTPKPTALLLTVVLMVGLFPVVNWLAEFNMALSFPNQLSDLENWMRALELKAAGITEKILVMDSYADLLVNLLVIAVLPACGEELIFRGIIQRIIAQWTKSIHWGIWIAGILFSLMHMQFFGFLPRMLLGVMFGYLLVWSGSIWLPILAHFINNAFAVLLSFLIQMGHLTPGTEQMGAKDGEWTVTLGSLLIVALILIYHKKRSKEVQIEQTYLQ